MNSHVVQTMRETRIAAVGMLWPIAFIYSLVPYAISRIVVEEFIRYHGSRYVVIGYLISATIASVLLSMVYFRWKWKNNDGFGWVVVLMSLAFGVHLVLAALSDLLVGAYGPGLSFMEEGGSMRLYRPETVTVIGQLVSAVIYIFSLPVILVLFAVGRRLDHAFSRPRHKRK